MGLVLLAGGSSKKWLGLPAAVIARSLRLEAPATGFDTLRSNQPAYVIQSGADPPAAVPSGTAQDSVSQTMAAKTRNFTLKSLGIAIANELAIKADIVSHQSRRPSMSTATTNSSTNIAMTISSKLRRAPWPEVQSKSLPKQDSEDRRIKTQAIELLADHPHFRSQNHSVDVRCQNQSVCLYGYLPTYYLKQLAQEAMRELEVSIENRIIVVSPWGEVVEHWWIQRR